MQLRTLNTAEVKNKRVLVRVDFNIVERDGVIVNDFRIKRTIPTFRYLLKNKAKIIVVTHFGRPPSYGADGEERRRFSVKKIAQQLEKDLGHSVKFISECVGPKAQRASANLKSGEILMLENLRFHKEEEENNTVFASQLASLADVYVNDAFSVSHRAHASVSAITAFLPSYAGLLLEQEVSILHEAYTKPKLPLVIVMGGAKIGTKAKLIKRFFDKASDILLGGVIANFVLKLQGIAIGKSKYEEHKNALENLNWTSSKLHLPLDVIVAKEISPSSWVKTVATGNVQDDEIILDIGPETTNLFASIVASAGTIIWNGPLGFIELPLFAAGTIKFARAMAASKAFTIVGGGDSVVLLDKLGLYDTINFVSTGGGAMLEFLSGGPMPGIEALRKNL